jgi:hypothetical protein
MYETVATFTCNIFTAVRALVAGDEKINVRDMGLVQAKTGIRYSIVTTNMKQVPEMGTQCVKKGLVSVNICHEVGLVGVVVPNGKRRNKTGKVLHTNAEVYGIVNRVFPAHYQSLILCDPF